MSILRNGSTNVKNNHRLLIFLIILSTSLLLTGVVFGVMLLSGKVVVTVTSSSDKLVRLVNVCGDSDVKDVNKLASSAAYESTGQAAKLKNLADKIKSRKDYKLDYTCLNIVALSAQYNNDVNLMSQVAADMASLDKRGEASYVRADLNYKVSASGLMNDLRRQSEGSKTSE